jgi:hypothetical protein
MISELQTKSALRVPVYVATATNTSLQLQNIKTPTSFLDLALYVRYKPVPHSVSVVYRSTYN